jgi:signal transduction histidine kinase
MSLVWKIILSYLIVIAVSLLVMAISTAFIAPIDFSQHMGGMTGMTQGIQRGMMGPGTSLENTIDAGFRDTLNRALLAAGIAATLVAAALSWYVSQRIAGPIRGLVKASRYIAAGHYSERLVANQTDEIGELTRSFNQMAAALADTETMRQQLIADVSHELKTPLASIKGYMEGLQDGIIPPTPETYQLVHREADRLQRLVSDLQELSRAEVNQLQMEVRPCSPVELVNLAVAALRPQYNDKRILLEATLPADMPAVPADMDRIRQVLINLLGNALQYTPSGGRVSVRLSHADGLMQFSVQDNGIGLSTVDLERVFQRFYRVDKSRARRSGGSGIGLTIARHIVEAHGGRIWAESAGSGQGSTFRFTLPTTTTLQKLHNSDISGSR